MGSVMHAPLIAPHLQPAGENIVRKVSGVRTASLGPRCRGRRPPRAAPRERFHRLRTGLYRYGTHTAFRVALLLLPPQDSPQA
eukprot:2744971-Prymnesium_polylepis.1